MPATQPEHNSLMWGYSWEAGPSGKESGKSCGVRNPRSYVARRQSFRSNNAEKSSRGMSYIVYLSEQERLELQAEIMEHHVTAWGVRTHRSGAHGRRDTTR